MVGSGVDGVGLDAVAVSAVALATAAVGGAITAFELRPGLAGDFTDGLMVDNDAGGTGDSRFWLKWIASQHSMANATSVASTAIRFNKRRRL